MSRESILNALPEHYIRQMRNWARAGAGISLDCKISSIYAATAGDLRTGARGEQDIPILLGEALDANVALGALPARERSAVSLFWQYDGRSLEWLGRRLSPEKPLDYRTVETRVCRGHDLHRAELRRLSLNHARLVEQHQQRATA